MTLKPINSFSCFIISNFVLFYIPLFSILVSFTKFFYMHYLFLLSIAREPSWQPDPCLRNHFSRLLSLTLPPFTVYIIIFIIPVPKLSTKIDRKILYDVKLAFSNSARPRQTKKPSRLLIEGISLKCWFSLLSFATRFGSQIFQVFTNIEPILCTCSKKGHRPHFFQFFIPAVWLFPRQCIHDSVWHSLIV